MSDTPTTEPEWAAALGDNPLLTELTEARARLDAEYASPTAETRDSFRVTSAGGFIVVHFKNEKATLTKQEARRLAAAINKAAL